MPGRLARQALALATLMSATGNVDRALMALLDQLMKRGYQFVTPTPATHERITARSPKREARNLRDALGWSLPFDPAILDTELLTTLRAAEALVPAGGGRVKSRYRVSSIGDELMLHSAYPTDHKDAVFFGPDSYRFADFIRAELACCPRHGGTALVDIGTGSGVGAIVAAKVWPDLRITMTDINAYALRLARINAAAAGVEAQYVHGSDLDGVEGPVDIAMANPPYIIDPAGRRYRDGGGSHGGLVSYQMAVAALDRLSPCGRFMLYTGSAIIDGQDPLRDALTDLSDQRGCTIRYRELDPDVFGEELDQTVYGDVERIAIVGAVISLPDEENREPQLPGGRSAVMASLSLQQPQRRTSQFLTDSFQRGLAHWNRERLAPQFPPDNWQTVQERNARMGRLEIAFIEELRSEVSVRAATVPSEPDAFVAWFEELKASGPGQGDPLFPWLAETATRDELRWFFEQEAAGEAGFDDLVAYTQVKLPVSAKMELARNYWDEMGRGNVNGMHGPMLDALVDTLNVNPIIENTVWESLTLANAMTAMATNRHYAWHSVGALGVIELTAPGRSAMVAKGLRRIGLSDKERRYFDLHAVLDVKHSEAWNREALGPLVEEDPRRAAAIAEGALTRLLCGERCFKRYRAHLWSE